MTKFAKIDYGYGIAKFWGDFDEASCERAFYEKANQCFGIRKSIAGFSIVEMNDSPLPPPWASLAGAAWVLRHSGDTIVWDADGEKIKTEWD